MRVVTALLLVVALCLPGCSDKRQIREWRPSDHDQPEDEGQVEVPDPETGEPPQQREPGEQADADGGEAPADPAQMTEILWRQQCIRCHGRDGSGRTSMAERMPVADLRESELTEDEIVQVVTKGRRRMPSFTEDLDAEQIRALAKKVLSLRQQR